APSATPFVTLREGLGRLVHVLAERLDDTTVCVEAPVRELRRRGEQGYDVVLDDRTLPADAVVLTVPAYVAAGLLSSLDRGLSDQLAGIPYASSVTVSLAFRKEDLHHDLDGYGFVVPRVKNRLLIA